MRQYAYRLAKEMGCWDVEGMLEQMTVRQFMGWVAYDALEAEQIERSHMQAKATASVDAMKRSR